MRQLREWNLDYSATRRHRTGILCFTLLTLLFILLAAQSAFAYTLTLTVNDNGTQGVVYGYYYIRSGCGGNRGQSLCSDNVTNYGDTLVALGPGALDYDANGNFTDVFDGWSGCPSALYNECDIDPWTGYNITANYHKAYGLPSNINITLAGNGTGYVYTTDAAGPAGPPNAFCAIYCGGGYNTCSGIVNSGTSSSVVLAAGLTGANNYFSGWSGCPQPSGSSCSIPAGQNANVTATFIAYPIVTPSAGANGTISPNTSQTVAPSATTWFTVTPNSGYYIYSVTGCGGTLSGDVYTTGPITSNCNVSASFAALTPYTVTSSAGSNGSVNPSGSTIVYSGNEFDLYITPNSGYMLASLVDNGSNVTNSATWDGTGYSYGISNVTSNHTIKATFGVGPTPLLSPAFSMPVGIFLAVAGLGIIIWRRRKENGQTQIETR